MRAALPRIIVPSGSFAVSLCAATLAIATAPALTGAPAAAQQPAGPLLLLPERVFDDERSHLGWAVLVDGGWWMVSESPRLAPPPTSCHLQMSGSCGLPTPHWWQCAEIRRSRYLPCAR